MRLVSNQPGRLYATAKTITITTHNFTSEYIHLQCSKEYSELFKTIITKMNIK